jgi:hypothetical protein
MGVAASAKATAPKGLADEAAIESGTGFLNSGASEASAGRPWGWGPTAIRKRCQKKYRQW